MNPLRWRKMTWVLVVWSGIMLAWIIGGSVSAQNSSDCDQEATAELRQLCEDATDVGTSVGVGLLIVLWFLGFVVLSLIWFMTRRRGRVCPHCGEDVKKGRTTCKTCGYDFTLGSRSPAEAEPV